MSQAAAEPHNGQAPRAPGLPAPPAPESAGGEAAKPRHHHAAACPSCGYSFAGLNTAVCPECGVVVPPSVMTEPAGPSLTATTTHGFAWVMTGTLIGKAIATVGQIALAWLLTKDDFGTVATALAIAAFPGVLQSGGISTVLVQRQSRLGIYSNACFWAGACLSIFAGLLVLGASMTVTSPAVAKLLPIVAFNTILSGLTAVPYATLQARMRFKLLAGLNAITTTTQMTAAVPLAYLGFGPYSVVLATTLGAAITLILAWRKARPPIRRRPQIRRWRYIYSDASFILTTNLLWTVVGQGDRLVLGWMLGKVEVGVYYFAFNLSMQVSMLLMSNLSGVLFPTFSRLTGEPVRQVRAFLRAARALAAVGIPVALLQGAEADPVLHILFKDKWTDAIPVMQCFSVGMAAYVVGGAVTSMLMAQGRFRLLLGIAITYAAGFMVVFVASVHVWGTVGGAIAVSCCYWASGIVGVALAIRPHGGSLRETIEVYAWPSLWSVAALVPGVAAARAVPQGPLEHWLRAAIIGLSAAIIYPVLLGVFGGETYRDLRGVFDRLIGRAAGALRRGTAGA